MKDGTQPLRQALLCKAYTWEVAFGITHKQDKAAYYYDQLPYRMSRVKTALSWACLSQSKGMLLFNIVQDARTMASSLQISYSMRAIQNARLLNACAGPMPYLDSLLTKLQRDKSGNAHVSLQGQTLM